VHATRSSAPNASAAITSARSAASRDLRPSAAPIAYSAGADSAAVPSSTIGSLTAAYAICTPPR